MIEKRHQAVPHSNPEWLLEGRLCAMALDCVIYAQGCRKEDSEYSIQMLNISIKHGIDAHLHVPVFLCKSHDPAVICPYLVQRAL